MVDVDGVDNPGDLPLSFSVPLFVSFSPFSFPLPLFPSSYRTPAFGSFHLLLPHILFFFLHLEVPGSLSCPFYFSTMFRRYHSTFFQIPPLSFISLHLVFPIIPPPSFISLHFLVFQIIPPPSFIFHLLPYHSTSSFHIIPPPFSISLHLLLSPHSTSSLLLLPFFLRRGVPGPHTGAHQALLICALSF